MEGRVYERQRRRWHGQFYRPRWKHQRGYVRDDAITITFGGRGIPNGQPCYFVVHAFRENLVERDSQVPWFVTSDKSR